MAVPDPLAEYRQFTKPAELHKAINTLRGIVAGISCDQGVSGAEIQELVHWCSIHEHLRDRHPFSELLPTIQQSIQDGVIGEDELSETDRQYLEFELLQRNNVLHPISERHDSWNDG